MTSSLLILLQPGPAPGDYAPTIGPALLLLMQPSSLAVPPVAGDDLVEAVVLALQADATITTLASQGVWDRLAPRETVCPFVVVTELEQPLDLAYESDTEDATPGRPVDYRQVQVASYAGTKVAARALGIAVKGVLEDAPLLLLDGDLLYLRQQTRGPAVLEDDKGPDGGDVWQDVRIFKAIIDDF